MTYSLNSVETIALNNWARNTHKNLKKKHQYVLFHKLEKELIFTEGT